MIDIDAERQRVIAKILNTEGEEREAWLKVCGIVLALENVIDEVSDAYALESGSGFTGEVFDMLDNQLHEAVREAVKHE